MDVLARVERETGKPVVSTSQASVWAALRIIGHREPVNGYGRLLRELAQEPSIAIHGLPVADDAQSRPDARLRRRNDRLAGFALDAREHVHRVPVRSRAYDCVSLGTVHLKRELVGRI